MRLVPREAPLKAWGWSVGRLPRKSGAYWGTKPINTEGNEEVKESSYRMCEWGEGDI